MADNLQNQLKKVGSNLQNPPASKDALLKLLTVPTSSLHPQISSSQESFTWVLRRTIYVYMASSSGSPCSNVKCKNAIYVSRSGWKRLDQEVILCNQCYIAYRKKQFCYIYHKNSTFWSFCKFCNKTIQDMSGIRIIAFASALKAYKWHDFVSRLPKYVNMLQSEFNGFERLFLKIHRPCLVSMDWYVTLEDGGIMCIGCAPQDTALVSISQEITSISVAFVPQTLVENNQIIEKNLQEAQQSTPPAPLACETNENKLHTKAQAQAKVRNEKPPCGTSRRHEQYRYIPRMTEKELKQICKGLNVKVTPLFEKILSASDTGKSGRLVVPKKCAEEFFPSVDNGQSQPIIIQDSKAKNWNFNLRMWPNNNSRMYVLEGFEPYKKSMKLVEGDTVTFSRLDPEGKLVIGNRKVLSPSSQDGHLPKAKSTSTSNHRAKKGMVTSTTSKQVSKRKRASTARKPSDMIIVESDLVTAKGGVGTRRKTSKIRLIRKHTEKQNKRLKVVKRAQELVDSPRGSNVPSDVMEKGNERRRDKDTEVTETGNVVTSPVPYKWIKRHPRHRSRCRCIVCKPASRSKHTRSSSTMRVKPKSPNINDQTTTIGNSEDNQHVTSVSGSVTKVRPFDLNLQPEPDEEFMDTMNLDL
ncbi:hypothetical protein E3N88_12154 [Mikania micrantha]|uniref:TF-B3 domain-containing protein n=1 Tax=Mikania micrantha TaxID=192012 RepID=A0A5N6P7P0_9ASTR|nr:hypothetical protein E3N88_12154 [Mikania micrantha]